MIGKTELLLYCNDAFCQPVFYGGIHVLSSSNTDFVNSEITYILSHNMEGCFLVAQYASGALLREVIIYSNYGSEMEWFSIGYDNPVV